MSPKSKFCHLNREIAAWLLFNSLENLPSFSWYNSLPTDIQPVWIKNRAHNLELKMNWLKFSHLYFWILISIASNSEICNYKIFSHYSKPFGYFKWAIDMRKLSCATSRWKNIIQQFNLVYSEFVHFRLGHYTIFTSASSHGFNLKITGHLRDNLYQAMFRRA